jgi:uncharacterized protein (DUF4415 family)
LKEDVRNTIKENPDSRIDLQVRASRDDAMKTKIVSYTPQTLPPLTKADRTKLKALAARPDSEIDTSDIPEMTDEQWKKAVRGHFYRPPRTLR